MIAPHVLGDIEPLVYRLIFNGNFFAVRCFAIEVVETFGGSDQGKLGVEESKSFCAAASTC